MWTAGMTTVQEQGGQQDDWLARKFEDGRLTDDCRYPECRDAPEPPKAGKPGPASRFCTAHNNKTDRQYTDRYEKRMAREREAAAEEAAAAPSVSEPLPQVLNRRAHNLQVLAELGPRLVAAVETITADQQTILDAEAVADHITGVQQQAEAQVREAGAARDAATRDAATAHRGTRFALLAAVTAVTEREAALKETATSQGEAATAHTQATAARTALEELTGQHRELRDRHQELTGAHEQLDTEHRTLAAQHRALQQTYGELAAQAGRQEGELSALRPQLDQLTARTQNLEAELRTATGELATATARVGSLQEQLGTEQTERTRERAEHQRALEALRAQQDEQRQEVERLRARLADLSRLQGDTATDVETFPLPGPEPVLLGVHQGRSWAMEPEPDHPDHFRLLADGTTVGTLTPVTRGSRPTGQWQATHRRHRLSPVTGRHFTDHTAAIHAVLTAEADHRPLPAGDDPVWEAIPPDLRSQLSGAALSVNPDKGHIAHLEPAAYRKSLAAAVRAARGHSRISPRHLAVLLDAPRTDFGPPSHDRAQRLYEVLQNLREYLVAGGGDAHGATA